jgi:hypothetical protein
MKEKVGSVFYLLLALHDPQGWQLFEKAHAQQKIKYKRFPTKSDLKSMNISGVKKPSSAAWSSDMESRQ